MTDQTDTRTFRVQRPDPQAAIDSALAQAQTAIDAARQVCARNGRIGLRQLGSMLSGELEETRAQTARCYTQGKVTYPTTEG